MGNETITQEQAVKIAEWLGGLYSRPTWLKRWINGERREKENEIAQFWLSSSDGSEAMMDKLLSDKFLIFFEDSRETPGLIEIELERDGTRGPKCIIVELKAPTRNAALKLAILEMLGGK